MDEADDYRKNLADIVLAAVLHPQDDRYEIVSRAVLDQARMVLDQSDLAASASRSRARSE